MHPSHWLNGASPQQPERFASALVPDLKAHLAFALPKTCFQPLTGSLFMGAAKVTLPCHHLCQYFV
jgi:hypothetical protein